MDRSNLIVNYLPSGFAEPDLQEFFGPFGPILSIKVVRDKHTGVSMGFGFVNFESNASASAAASALNGMALREDKVMKVSVARPAWKANIHSNLYIAGFPPAYTDGEVLDMLGVHATNAENVRLLRDSNKNLRGAAVIRMSSEESALGVISALNGVTFKNQPGGPIVQVRPWRPEFRVDRISDEIIANSFANVRSAQKKAPPTKRAPRFPDAEQLLGQLRGRSSTSILPLPTRTPESAPYETDEEDDLSVLIVYHLPEAASDETLYNLFAHWGHKAIESVQVMPGKGYGFVSFFSRSAAMDAMGRLNGLELEGSSKRIRIELK